MNGISDSPLKNLTEDCFGLKKYVEGLADYIKICETPTTIAVQGDWGSGKTSMLNMVKEKLGDDVKSIWFNTWQYSKFNMDEQLSVSLLTRLYLALKGSEKEKKVLSKLSFLAKASVKVGTYVIDAIGAQKLADDIGDHNNRISENENIDMIRAIENLKEDFQKEIDAIFEAEGKRIVVFIDDLDRLEPAKAVELMEVLKLFLDCRNCVYLLAIDYDVVTRGISVKYGDNFGKKQGKKFFDKIIQVPFFIPVEQYNIEEYLKKSISSVVMLKDEDVPCYLNLIRNSVGCNPRSMKRLFNAFLLINMINKDEGIEKDSVSQELLFATLCMQLSMEDIYKYIAERIDDVDDLFFTNMIKNEFVDIKIEDEEFNVEAAKQFMKEFAEIIHSTEGNNNLNKLKDIFAIHS